MAPCLRYNHKQRLATFFQEQIETITNKTTNKVGNFKERAYFCKQKITKYVEIWIFFLELHKKHSFFIVNMNYSGLTANVL